MGKKEIKVAIESMTRCPGNCSGCMLSAEERRASDFMPPDVVDGIRRFVADRADRVGRGNLEAIQILLGQGDHLLLHRAEVRPFLSWVRDLSEGTEQAAITLSGIGREDQVRSMADELQAASAELGNPIYPVLVLDFAKSFHPKFRETYERNIAYIRRRFGGLDLAINVGPGVMDTATPEEAHDFVRRNGFRHIQLNLVPTPLSAPAFARDWARIAEWIVRFHEVWPRDGAYEVDYGHLLFRLCHETDRLSADALVPYVAARFANEVYIDRKGDVFFMQGGGTGDAVPYTDRFGYAPVATVLQETFESLEASARRFAVRHVADHLRHPVCSRCPHMNACAASGFALTRRVMEPLLAPDGTCPIGVSGLFDSVERHRRAVGRYESLTENEVSGGAPDSVSFGALPSPQGGTG